MLAYYSWYDYYYFYNWNYLYEVGGIAAMILFPLVIVFIIALFKEQI